MKYEVRIFQGPRSKPRLSVNFTVDCDLTLQDIAETMKKAAQTCDTSANQKNGFAGSKEGM